MHCTTFVFNGLDFRPQLPVCDTPSPMLDCAAVKRAVANHCGVIGADESNTTAAIAWAHRNGFNTLHAIRVGKARAEALRARQR